MKKLAQNQSSPRVSRLTVAESWWSLPLGNRQVACYHAGRLINQLFWQAQLNLFFCADRYLRAVDEVLGQLPRATKLITNVRAPKTLQETRWLSANWRKTVKCENLAEEVAYYARDPDGEYQETTREEFCSDLVRSYVNPWMDDVRRAFLNDLGKRELAWVTLGEHVDQGVRRADLHPFLYRVPDRDLDTLELSSSELQRLHDLKSCDWNLANYAPQPGELPWCQFWWQGLQLCCHEVGLDAIPAESEVQDRASGTPPATRCAFVESVDSRIRQWLVDSYSLPKPKWDAEKRCLLLGDEVVKQYKNEAKRQTTLLAAFEEMKWPSKIDDPLDPGTLDHTLKDLNRTIKGIRFYGDGTGKCVRWRLCPDR